jgi:hypothetical protein
VSVSNRSIRREFHQPLDAVIAGDGRHAFSFGIDRDHYERLYHQVRTFFDQSCGDGVADGTPRPGTRGLNSAANEHSPLRGSKRGTRAMRRAARMTA